MQVDLTPEQQDFVRRAVDIAKASIDREEGIEISEQSMRALAEDIKRRGRAQLAAEQ